MTTDECNRRSTSTYNVLVYEDHVILTAGPKQETGVPCYPIYKRDVDPSILAKVMEAWVSDN